MIRRYQQEETDTMPKKTISDCQHDAVMLHGMAQGVDELLHMARNKPGAPSPAGNAAVCVCTVMIEKAEQLADELDRLETEESKR
ncbi:hypothetical protein C2I36_02155 [Rhodobacteraceae bacterium WD3A24]|nr:hypothetical protein C2I36_02155 [Rhodobacteraceae bacterium WD3A24]